MVLRRKNKKGESIFYGVLWGFIKPGPMGPSKIPLRGGQNQMALPLRFVPKITKPKYQITNKSQIPISNDQNLKRKEIVWILEFWSLEFV
jgi:hypothetical protein